MTERHAYDIAVFPTHVGVNRAERSRAERRSSCPHARGGEPIRRYDRSRQRSSCPHTRGGEPMLAAQRERLYDVVPTHVGVNRIDRCTGGKLT